MAYLEGVTEGISLAFGRTKSLPATSQCSLGQLINGAAMKEGCTFHIFTSLRICAQVRRDDAWADGRGGGRKPGTDTHEDALRGSQRNPGTSLSKPAPGRGHSCKEQSGLRVPATDGFALLKLSTAVQNLPVFSQNGFLSPTPDMAKPWRKALNSRWEQVAGKTFLRENQP